MQQKSESGYPKNPGKCGIAVLYFEKVSRKLDKHQFISGCSRIIFGNFCEIRRNTLLVDLPQYVCFTQNKYFQKESNRIQNIKTYKSTKTVNLFYFMNE